ncbi:MAG: Na(+)/H(+) antiporter subunit D [Deltaproteobacteria bacterium]
MSEWTHPALILIIGALAVPFLKGTAKRLYLLFLPVFAFYNLLHMPADAVWAFSYLGHELILCRVDKLSLLFGYIFTAMTFIGVVYALHLEDDRQHMAALFYAGSSIGVVFAGDFLTLFMFWEVMAFASAYLVFAQRSRAAALAGSRYLLVHIAGGLVLFAGIIIHFSSSGSLTLGPVDRNGAAYYLIMTGFMLNAAVVPLNAWLPDAYPEATVTGSVFMSVFTTKTAVYVLIRVFAGEEWLLWLGVFMAVFGVVYATMENDCRRLLSYHIISQVGYMVAGVGIGTELALNGAAAHAFTNMLYKSLLFMGAGAVIHATGAGKLTELGGLARKMPATFVLYMIGGFSISAFPLFAGFVSKSMIVSAAAHEKYELVTLFLMLASSGTLLSTTLKIPYYMFFGKEKSTGIKEVPLNMLVGMGMAALLCIGIGVYPGPLYSILPFNAGYEPYTPEHIMGSLGILVFTAVAFFLVARKIKLTDTVNLDTDWFYRKGAAAFMWVLNRPFSKGLEVSYRIFFDAIPRRLAYFARNPLLMTEIIAGRVLCAFSGRGSRLEETVKGEMAAYPADTIKHWPIGSTILWVTMFLLISVFLYL